MEDITQQIFYSNAERAVLESTQQRAQAKQWLALLQKQGGIKMAEDRWTGLTAWLSGDLDRILSKEELLQYIDSNCIQLEEVLLSNETHPNLQWEHVVTPKYNYYQTTYNDLTYIIQQDRTRYKVFDMDGILLKETDTLVSAQNRVEELVREHADITRNAEWTTPGLTQLKTLLLAVPNIEGYNQEDATHYGDVADGKVIAWIRFGEITDGAGHHVLVLDEIQSKRHQDGRQWGYRTVADRENFSIEDYIRRVPVAPFEKQWHELALKRMLRYAAENGYDILAWTTGEQQSERYNLNAGVKSVEFKSCNKQGFPALLTWHFSNAESKVKYVSDETELSRVIGKEPSKKILNGVHRLVGDDLQGVSNGMQAFYDQILVEFANKYTKKWNNRVRDIMLPIGTEGRSQMHALDITAEMRLSLMQEQPLFKEVENPYTQKDNQNSIRQTLVELSKKFNVTINIVPTRYELPEQIMRVVNSKKSRSLFPGMYDSRTGMVHFVLSEISSVTEAGSLFLHEVIAHKGIEGLLGKKRAYQFYARVFDSLDSSTQTTLLQKHRNKFVAGAEYVAQVAERNQNPSVIKRIILFFREILRSIGFNLDIHDNEIQMMLANSKKYLQHQKTCRYQSYTKQSQMAKSANNRSSKYQQTL